MTEKLGLVYRITKWTKQTAIYILKLNDGTYYCGISNCMERRLKQHVNGKSKHTSKHLPIKLVWLTWAPTRKDAVIIEQLIKNRGVKKWLKLYDFKQTKVMEAQVAKYQKQIRQITPKKA